MLMKCSSDDYMVIGHLQYRNFLAYIVTMYSCHTISYLKYLFLSVPSYTQYGNIYINNERICNNLFAIFGCLCDVLHSADSSVRLSLTAQNKVKGWPGQR